MGLSGADFGLPRFCSPSQNEPDRLKPVLLEFPNSVGEGFHGWDCAPLLFAGVDSGFSVARQQRSHNSSG